MDHIILEALMHRLEPKDLIVLNFLELFYFYDAIVLALNW